MLLKSFYPLECNVAILNEFPLSLFVYELPTALLGEGLAPALDFRSLNFEFWALGISFQIKYGVHKAFWAPFANGRFYTRGRIIRPDG